MAKPKIFIVGADKGGVGKTTVARLLIDYLTSKAVQTRIFDTEYPLGDLKRFDPASAVVDMRMLKDQMRVFHEISPEFATVLDIRAGVLSPTLKTLNDSHFLDDVRSGEVILVVLHVLGPTIASLTELRTPHAPSATGLCVIWWSRTTSTTPITIFPADDEIFLAMAPSLINIKTLPPIACERVQNAAATFDAYTKSGDSRMLRGTVRHWVDAAYSEFERVGIPNILAN